MPRELIRIGLAVALAAPAAGCVGVTSQERAALPEWFTGQLAKIDDRPFPRLQDVPNGIAPLRPDAEWAAIERDLRAAGRSVAVDPRNVRADTAAAIAEAEDARRELETPRAQTPGQ